MFITALLVLSFQWSPDPALYEAATTHIDPYLQVASNSNEIDLTIPTTSDKEESAQ